MFPEFQSDRESVSQNFSCEVITLSIKVINNLQRAKFTGQFLGVTLLDSQDAVTDLTNSLKDIVHWAFNTPSPGLPLVVWLLLPSLLC